jgi:hypothetical protein
MCRLDFLNNNKNNWSYLRPARYTWPHSAIYTDATFVSSLAKPHTYLASCLLRTRAKHPPSLPPSISVPTYACPCPCLPTPLSRHDRPPLVPSLTFTLRLLLDARASGKDLERLVASVEALKTPSSATTGCLIRTRATSTRWTRSWCVAWSRSTSRASRGSHTLCYHAWSNPI